MPDGSEGQESRKQGFFGHFDHYYFLVKLSNLLIPKKPHLFE
jgi:hypothetical protein